MTQQDLWLLNQQWNATETDYPEHLCLHQQFEQQVVSQPDHPALFLGKNCYTYSQLNAMANQVAHFLLDNGAQPDMRIGLCVERSLDMVVGLLAILKAGAAYVPLDPNYPQERLSFLIQDSKAHLILTQEEIVERLPETRAPVHTFGDLQAVLHTYPESNPTTTVTPNNLVYVIFTSGSTGQPKGVMLEHRGRVNNFYDFNSRFSVGSQDRVLAIASVSFDMCAYDVFGILAAGASIVLPEPQHNMNPTEWARLIQKHNVTLWHTVPALLEMLVAEVQETPERWPSSLRLLLLAGDWIPVSLPDRFRALVPDAQLIGLGGATEASMDSTIYEIGDVDPEWKSIPYGAPMANQKAYVLNEALELLPVGEPGELHLGGIGVARGYLHRPELTEEKFIPDPFSDVPGARMYKTGDLCRWLPDGNLQILGRMDHQVKIRGVRIELGEIETILRQHSAIREAVVLAQDYGRGRQLIAYLLKDPEFEPEKDILHAMYQEQVQHWSEVYNTAYNTPKEALDPTFNLASWNSSYTQKPIPVDEMKLWVDSTVERILARKPKRVLEIGCGLGLLLFQIAPHCEKYVGTDISGVALQQLKNTLAWNPLPQVTLHQQAADQWEELGEEKFDMIVLNSVILDFPSAEYLTRVLEAATQKLSPGGTIFVGDIRPLCLAEPLQSSVQLFQASAEDTVEELLRRVRLVQSREEELLVDPSFFSNFQANNPDITSLDFQLKRGFGRNELVRFRYDVTLGVKEASRTNAELDWQEWGGGGAVSTIENTLRQSPTRLHAWCGIPNKRTRGAVAVWKQLQELAAETSVFDLHEEPWEAESIDPETLYNLAELCGFVAHLRWDEESPAHLDAIFVPQEQETQWSLPPVSGVPPHANNPLLAQWWRRLPTTLREQVSQTLPEVMHPSAYVLLDEFPLTPNGKVNRRAMPRPDSLRLQERSLESPQSLVEEFLVELWAELLELEDVGRGEDFFALGGHSLLAVQLVSRIREWLQLEVSLRTVFDAPVLADFANMLTTQAQQQRIELEATIQSLFAVLEMSDEEVAAQLEQNT